MVRTIGSTSTVGRREYRVARPQPGIMRGVREPVVAQPHGASVSAAASFRTSHAVRPNLWRVEIERPIDTSVSVACAITTGVLLCCGGCKSEDAVEFLHSDFVQIAFGFFLLVIATSLVKVVADAQKKQRAEAAIFETLARQVAKESANIPPVAARHTTVRAPPQPERSADAALARRRQRKSLHDLCTQSHQRCLVRRGADVGANSTHPRHHE